MRAAAQRSPVYYGWVILTLGILGTLVGGGTTFWAVTLYIPAIADDFGVARFPVVLAFMVGQACAALMGPLSGRWIDRNGARRAIVVGGVATAALLVLSSRSTNLWQLVIGWSAAGVGRSLLFPVPYNWLLTRWFARRQQMALGVVTVGFGLGGAVVLPALTAIEARAGWSAAMAASGLILLLGTAAPALLLVVDRPGDAGLAVEGSGAVEAPGRGALLPGFSLAQALRSASFWLLTGGLMLLFIGQGSVTTLSFDYFDSRGVANGATIVAIGALLRGVMRLPFGILLGRVQGVFRLAVLVALSQVVAMTLLLTWLAPPGLALYLLFWGLGGSFVPMLEAVLIARTFGVRHFGAISGMSQLVSFVGQIAGPVGGAALFDATGSYVLAFSVYLAATVCAAGLLLAAAGRVHSRSYREAQRAVGITPPGESEAV